MSTSAGQTASAAATDHAPAEAEPRVLTMERVKNASAVKAERAWLGALAAAGLPGLFNFDTAPLAVPATGLVRRLRLTAVGWGRMSIEQIIVASNLPPGRRQYEISCASPEVLGKADPFVASGLTTKWLRDPWMEAVFTPPLRAGTFRLRSRSAPVGTRAMTIDVEDDAGTIRRYRHPSVRSYAMRLGDFQRRMQVLVDIAARHEAVGEWGHRLVDQCAALVDAVREALEQPETDLVRLNELRRALLLDCTRLLRALDGRSLGLVIQDGAWCLDQLLARPPASDTADEADLTVPAVAYVLLAELLKASPLTPLVKAHPVVTRYRSLVSSAADIASLEAIVSERYDAVMVGLPFQPLMLRVHGLSGPTLARYADIYLAAMHELQLALAQLGQQCCLCYGTLLGAVRERDFIAHDDDIDMGILIESAEPQAAFLALLDQLNAMGFSTHYDKRFFAQTTPPGRDFQIDLFPIVVTSEEWVEMHMEDMKIRPVPKDIVVPLTTLNFRGIDFLAPCQPQAFLADRYGPDWGTPRRKLGHEMAT